MPKPKHTVNYKIEEVVITKGFKDEPFFSWKIIKVGTKYAYAVMKNFYKSNDVSDYKPLYVSKINMQENILETGTTLLDVYQSIEQYNQAQQQLDQYLDDCDKKSSLKSAFDSLLRYQSSGDTQATYPESEITEIEQFLLKLKHQKPNNENYHAKQ